jgi:large subunit ribosomal protein L7/L12
MPDLHRIVEQLSQLTVMEAAELSRRLEEHWGVSASAPVATVAVESITQPEVPPQEEFTVLLVGVSADKKINVIKEVRQITGLGLKEAKEFTESAGPNKVLKEFLTKTDADTLRQRMADAGAMVEIK